MNSIIPSIQALIGQEFFSNNSCFDNEIKINLNTEQVKVLNDNFIVHSESLDIENYNPSIHESTIQLRGAELERFFNMIKYPPKIDSSLVKELIDFNPTKNFDF